MSTTFTKRICSVGLLAALCATAACQSSGSKAGGGAAAGNTSAATAAAATTAAAAGGGSSAAEGDAAGGGSSAAGGNAGGAPALSGIDAKYCAAIKVADAQALTTATLSAARTGGPESCTFVLPGESLNGDNITVTVFEGDGDKKFYNDAITQDFQNGGTALPGVGEVAAWGQPVVGESGPEVAAHKGSVSCVVQLPSDLSTITIDKTGGPIYNVTADAAASFAVKMGMLCNDVFSAGT